MAHAPSVDALDARLKDFVEGHIHGWSHDEWDALVHELSAEGHIVSDTRDLGLRLERAHILATLDRIEVAGVGPKRRERVADAFASLWHLRQATVDQLATIPTFHRALAEALHDGLARRTGGF